MPHTEALGLKGVAQFRVLKGLDFSLACCRTGGKGKGRYLDSTHLSSSWNPVSILVAALPFRKLLHDSQHLMISRNRSTEMCCRLSSSHARPVAHAPIKVLPGGSKRQRWEEQPRTMQTVPSQDRS